MNEFPDSDEEYDLLETTTNKSFTEPPAASNIETEKCVEVSSKKLSPPTTTSKEISPAIQQISDENTNAAPVENTKKRTYEELLRDFGDLFEDETIFANPNNRDKKPRWDEPEAVINMILRERKKMYTMDGGNSSAANRGAGFVQSLKDCISTRVPSWNFIALTRLSDSQRIYLRIQNKKNQLIMKDHRPITGLLASPYSELKAEAEEIILRNVQRASLPAPNVSRRVDDQLWVDKYRPRKYLELLSDETVNRSFLSWIRLWDKIVFNREVVQRKETKAAPTYGFGKKKFFRKNEPEGLDAQGFPTHRIALLSGPPGLGKTTLAHLVAKHAGYNVVEVNASDDRDPAAFRQALVASTEMRSLMGSDPRPNCLVLDEIDGAPAASIDLLIKFVQGKLVPKGKKNKADSGGKKLEGCKRPVICICNEAYTPSLRALRAMAFVIPVPKVSAERLADRLMTIARKEKIRSDQGALLQLAERSGCDVRSCLCALQYMGEASGKNNYQLGLKDAKRGLFDCWKDILEIPMTRGGPMTIRERAQVVLKAAYSGETERLAQGIFHNYPETAPPKMDIISKTLEWFQLYDKITTVVMTRQDWRLMPYTNHAFIAWHIGFARKHSGKISYPYAPAEANQSLNKRLAILTATKRAYGRDIQTLALDIAPFLSPLLTPKLRSVSCHLYSPKERADLVRLINVMLELGLLFVQAKNDDGTSDYVLDPNVCEVGIFPECKVNKSMPYAVKQFVAQELEVERLKRAAIATGVHPETNVVKETTVVEEKKTASQSVPNHLRQLEPMAVEPKTAKKYRNFFENFTPIRTISTGNRNFPRTSPKPEKSVHRVRQILTKYGVWYKYKEGFSNSVRRKVKMSDLL